MEEITIPFPDDLHVHFRQGEMLRHVVPYTSRWFRRALVMPNTTPAILTADDVRRYRAEIIDAARNDAFTPLMTVKLTGATTPAMIEDAKAEGVIAGKLYPEGVTTNSEDGVSADGIKELYPVFETMQKCGMVLSLHGEVPNEYVLLREEMFLETFEALIRDFPNLKIVLEHITTMQALGVVAGSRPGVAGTITLHHLLLTLNDVLCDKRNGNEFLNPHNYCKPVAKSPDDRRMLVTFALSGHPKFFLGSDTAPHLREKKECDCGCAGVWSAPVLLPLLAQTFGRLGKLESLRGFVSEFGADFYDLKWNPDRLTLRKVQPYKVEPILNGIVPFYAGKELTWKVV